MNFDKHRKSIAVSLGLLAILAVIFWLTRDFSTNSSSDKLGGGGSTSFIKSREI
jgi:hypothetical protein